MAKTKKMLSLRQIATLSNIIGNQQMGFGIKPIGINNIQYLYDFVKAIDEHKEKLGAINKFAADAEITVRDNKGEIVRKEIDPKKQEILEGMLNEEAEFTGVLKLENNELVEKFVTLGHLAPFIEAGVIEFVG